MILRTRPLISALIKQNIQTFWLFVLIEDYRYSVVKEQLKGACGQALSKLNRSTQNVKLTRTFNLGMFRLLPAEKYP